MAARLPIPSPLAKTGLHRKVVKRFGMRVGRSWVRIPSVRWDLSVLQLSSVWYMRSEKPIYALHPVSQSFPSVAFETVPMFVSLAMVLSRPFREARLALLSTPLSSSWSLVVMSLASCLQLVSQAPEHFRSSEKQTTCEGCFARQCICSVISIHSGSSAPTGVLEGGCRPLTSWDIGQCQHVFGDKSALIKCNQTSNP